MNITPATKLTQNNMEKQQMKPYIVTLETAIVVMAESQKDAEKWTRDNFSYIDDLSSRDNFDITAEKMTYYPGGWNKDCLPYGAKDGITLEKILENDADYQAKLKELREIRAKYP